MRNSLKMSALASMALIFVSAPVIDAHAAATGGATGAAGGAASGGSGGGGSGGYNPAVTNARNDPQSDPRRPGHSPLLVRVGDCAYLVPVFDSRGEMIGYRSVYRCR